MISKQQFVASQFQRAGSTRESIPGSDAAAMIAYELRTNEGARVVIATSAALKRERDSYLKLKALTGHPLERVIFVWARCEPPPGR